MQLYHLLSVYKIIRPPKFGNCRNGESLQDLRPKISFEEFKKAFAANECKSYREKHINNLKEKLDGYIQDENWECDDIIEVDSEMSDNVLDCIIYYICGFLCRRMLKKLKCQCCRQAFSSQDINSIFPVSDLVNLRNKGGLTHPNRYLYQMFRQIEDLFIKHIKSGNVYHLVIKEIFDNGVKLTFPCKEHKTNILSECIHYYLCVRMRQYARIENKNSKKVSKKYKKQAKIVDC